ncbi:uncharacterized protein LOC135619781 [Musa acuminata AAA Group]|uniref:uncharacterized protein LOC135619781 n=1 Tax=Musa acuminata AAA Group TaxID=214697 RepID=UPI0031D652AE
MAGDMDASGDFYSVLGLKKECSEAELRNAYKKLALKWHPDKCSASGNEIRMKEAKQQFQEIQKAYSVLSDSNKRFLYDVGAYDKDDDKDEEGMVEFLGEMAQMMRQTKRCGSGQESFEQLQQMFVEMFHDDLDAGFCGHSSATSGAASCGNKRDNSAMDSGKRKPDELDPAAIGFCLGTKDAGQSSKGRGSNSKRRNRRKQKASSKHDNSSHNAKVSA